jgi:tetratricopeptide (TPR) repeat protein
MDLPAGFRDRLDDVSEYVYAALIIILSIISMTIFLWLMYSNRGLATAAEQNALMSALFVSDTIAFVVASAAVAFCLYLSSLRFGDLHGLLRLETYAVFFIAMLAPIIFIGADILLQPQPLEDYGVNIALGLSVVSIASGVLFIAMTVMRLRPRERIQAQIDRIREAYHSAGAKASADTIAIMPQMAGTSLSLMVFLKKLSATGDPEPVLQAIDRLSHAALEEAGKKQDTKALAAAGGLIAHIVEAGAIGAETGNMAVVCRTIERLKDIATTADVEAVESAAFRGIGYTCNECMRQPGRFRTGTFDPWLAGVYASIHDVTGKRESLDRAVATIERALADRSSLCTEEQARAMFMSGQVLRRVAETRHSEEKALLAISQLTEARAMCAVGGLEATFIDIEIGRAYAALAAMKNPIKSYKKALSQYEEAGKAMGPGVSRYDAAMLDSLQGYAHAMLADEYSKARRYDDALDSARSAIERYASAVKYFTPGRSPEGHGLIMSGAGLAHTLISEIYTHSREFDGALNQATLAIDCYTSALETVDKVKSPESYASLKVSIGIAQVDLAEICFKEKRYDEAISACDRAIACYNEALRIYESQGKEKQAAPARKYLKEANDLFNTFMMIGSGLGGRQLELGDGI